MSRAHTSWPSSAKQAAVTRPTQPTPITPMGSLSAIAAEEATERDYSPRTERAMAIICLSLSVSSSVLEIQ